MSEIGAMTFDTGTMRQMAQPSAESIRRKMASLAGSTVGGSTPETVDEALDAFQNILFSQMVKAMRSTVPESELFEKSSGEEIFESMLDERYAAELARQAGSLGLTAALKDQLGLPDGEPARIQELALPEGLPARLEELALPLPGQAGPAALDKKGDGQQ